MDRADRLLQIVQILRRESKPVSAQAIAEELEVAVRTIYRDMLAMESIKVPVHGEAGVGYVLKDGCDLPPLVFNSDELEVLMLGARFVMKHGDFDQEKSAKDVIAKVAAVLTDELRDEFFGVQLYVPPNTPRPDRPKTSTSTLRQALRDQKIIDIRYRDEVGIVTRRTVWPIALGYFETSRLLVAWCDMRRDYRSFRIDRIVELIVTDNKVPRAQKDLLKEWQEAEKARTDSY